MRLTRIANEETLKLELAIEQLRNGDTSVRGELLNLACLRLLHLTSQLRHDFQELEGDPTTEEVFQNASLRLYRAMHDMPINGVRQFYQLAAIHIRRELIELGRQCENLASRSSSQTDSDREAKRELQQWLLFHRGVDELPHDKREVFELIWYHNLNRDEAADLLGVPMPHVRRLWRSARMSLHDLLNGGSFPCKSMCC